MSDLLYVSSSLVSFRWPDYGTPLGSPPSMWSRHGDASEPVLFWRLTPATYACLITAITKQEHHYWSSESSDDERELLGERLRIIAERIEPILDYVNAHFTMQDLLDARKSKAPMPAASFSSWEATYAAN